MPKPPQKLKRLGLPIMLLAGTLGVVHVAEAAGPRRINSGGMNGHLVWDWFNTGDGVDVDGLPSADPELTLPFDAAPDSQPADISATPESAGVGAGTISQSRSAGDRAKDFAALEDDPVFKPLEAPDLAQAPIVIIVKESVPAPEPEPEPVAKATVARRYVTGSSPSVSKRSDQAYLPVYGPVAMRMRPEGDRFDRSKLISLASYQKQIEEERARAEATNPPASDSEPPEALADNSPEPKPGSDKAPPVDAASKQPEPGPDGTPTVVSTDGPAAVNPTDGVMLGRPLSSMTLSETDISQPIDPTVVLRYFDDKKDESGRPRTNVDIPFLLPNQAQQPLIMEGNATYQRSDK